MHPTKKPFIDGAGNVWYTVGLEAPTTLFSCHVDTVHRSSGEQEVWGDLQMGWLWKEDGDPLGADNGAGCWLLTELIRGGVPGLYIFHQGEECGGIGSRYVAEHKADALAGIKRAIAFDRRKDCSVITEMSAGIVCSDEFATAMCALLDLGHKPDNTGSFTDTANYRKLIPECTNISVGYDNEHGGSETLDFEYLLRLRDRVIEVGRLFDELPVERDPSKPDPSRYSVYNGARWDFNRGSWDDDYAYPYSASTSTASKGDEVAEPKKKEDADFFIADPKDAPWDAAQELFTVLVSLGLIDVDSKDFEGEFILDALYNMAVHETSDFRHFVEELGASYFETILGEWQVLQGYSHTGEANE